MRFLLIGIIVCTAISCGFDIVGNDLGVDSRVRRDFKVYDGFYEQFKKDGNRPSCGDHICNGSETWRSCWMDCTPQPWNFNLPRDPGWIDPVREVCNKKYTEFFWNL